MHTTVAPVSEGTRNDHPMLTRKIAPPDAPCMLGSERSASVQHTEPNRRVFGALDVPVNLTFDMQLIRRIDVRCKKLSASQSM